MASSMQTSATLSPVSGSTRVTGVFGYPVEHSLSPAMHNAAFSALRLPYIYVPFPVPPQAIGPAIRSLPALGIVGVNLTIPHKESVLPFLDEVTQEAREVGAVNTVHCTAGRLLGDNTDGRGFLDPLVEAGVRVSGAPVFVLGAGGAARAAVFRLAREGARVTVANRHADRAERLAAAVRNAVPGAEVRALGLDDPRELEREARRAELVVNTTRVGMHPDSGELPPLPLSALNRGQTVYDLVYNPAETRLLQAARERGCRTLTGVRMLVCQGAAAFERWTGMRPPTGVMEAAVLDGLARQQAC